MRGVVGAYVLCGALLITACSSGSATQPTATVTVSAAAQTTAAATPAATSAPPSAPTATMEDRIAQKAWDEQTASGQLSSCEVYAWGAEKGVINFWPVVDRFNDLKGEAKTRMEDAINRVLATNCS